MKIVKLSPESIQEITGSLLKRSPSQYTEYEDTVNDILKNIRENRDKALFEYTSKFDGFTLTPDNIRVTKSEIEEAYTKLDPEYIEVIRKAAANISDFHKKQLRNSWFETKPDGSLLGMKITAIEKLGVYVPGGKAAYPSSVLMNIIPAKVAGVDRIIMCTPPGKTGVIDPGTLVAADIAGADEIYRAGASLR